MATYSVSAGDYLRPWGVCRIKEYPVHVSQTVLKGSVLTVGAAGYENRVQLATDTTVSGIVGVALEAITTSATHNAVTDRVLVACADPDTVFMGRTVADDAVDFSDIGVRVELEIDGTYSITRVETDQVTYETVMVVGYLNPTTMNELTTEGDVSAWALVKFLPGASIFIPTVLA